MSLTLKRHVSYYTKAFLWRRVSCCTQTDHLTPQLLQVEEVHEGVELSDQRQAHVRDLHEGRGAMIISTYVVYWLRVVPVALQRHYSY